MNTFMGLLIDYHNKMLFSELSFLGLFLSIVFFIFYINFTLYGLMLLILLYFLVFSYFISFGIELLGLFLLIIYIGGILVLFLFLIFLIGSNISLNKNIFNFSQISYLEIILSFLFLFVTFWFFFKYFDISYLLYKFTKIKNYELVFKYHLLKPSIYGIDSFYSFFLSTRLYSKYYLSVFLMFLIFILGLIAIISVSKNFNSSDSHINIISFKNNNKYDVFYVNLPFFDFLWDFFSYLNNHDIINVNFLMLSTFFFFTTLAFILSIALLPLLLKNFNFIKFLIWVEMIVLLNASWLLYFSYIYSDIDGLIFTFFIFGIYAIETVLGLCIFSSYKLDFKKL